MLQKLFNERELYKSLNPDEAVVAYGVAVLAATLSKCNNDYKICKDLVLLDVTPLSLGVELKGKRFDVVVPRNTPIIPTKKSKIYYTIKYNQSFVEIMVYQGERTKSKDNHLLGMFKVTEIPSAPKGVAKIMVCFEIDPNGILTVTAEILSTGKMNKLMITNKNGRGGLCKEEIEKMIKDADKYKQEDQQYMKKVDAYNALEDYIYKMKNKIGNMDRLKKMEHAIADTTKWIEQNQDASVDKGS